MIAVAALFLTAAAEDTDPAEKYVSRWADTAVSEMQRTGVPASITLAQALLESGSGRSQLAVRGNNHFGIKCTSDWKGKTMSQDDDAKGECFRVYASATDSYRDHSDFLRYRDRYRFLFEFKTTDYKSWAYGLKKAGYATDAEYAGKLISLIEKYKLHRFDTNNPEMLPVATPAQAETVVEAPFKVRESYRFSLTGMLYEKNGVPFVYAMDGDSYASVAEQNGLFLRELLKFNDLSVKDCELLPGTAIYLRPKKSRAARGLEKYIVESDGESLRDISQRFAVKVNALRRLNKSLKDGNLREGDTIILR